jgi:hypothetical protein
VAREIIGKLIEQPPDTRTLPDRSDDNKREFNLSRHQPSFRPSKPLTGSPLPSGPLGGVSAQETGNRDPKDCKDTVRGVSAQRQNHDQRPSLYDGKPLPGWRFPAEFKDYKFGCGFAEKLHFLSASRRFWKIVTGIDTAVSEAHSDAVELMDIFSLIDFAKLRADLESNPFDLSPFKGIDLVSLDHGKGRDTDSDAEKYGEDASPGQNSPVQYGGWQVTRDLEPHARRLHNQDMLRLMWRELGHDFEILMKCICLDWARRDLGRTETSYKDDAVCAGVGTALVLAALRHLVAFFDRLDRLESGERPLRDCLQLAAWCYAGKEPLVMPRRAAVINRPIHHNEAAIAAGLLERQQQRAASMSPPVNGIYSK